MTVSPQPGPYRVGQTLQVVVILQTDQPVRAAGAALSFNPAVMRCDGVVEGSFFNGWAAANNALTVLRLGRIDNANGTISETSVSLIGGPSDPAAAQGPAGSGTVVSYHFTVLASGVSYLNLIKAWTLHIDGNPPPDTNLAIRNAQVDVNILVSSIGTTHINATVESLLAINIQYDLPPFMDQPGWAGTEGSITIKSNGLYRVDVAGYDPPGVEGSQPPAGDLWLQADGFSIARNASGVLVEGEVVSPGNGDEGEIFDLYFYLFTQPAESAQTRTHSYQRILVFHCYVTE